MDNYKNSVRKMSYYFYILFYVIAILLLLRIVWLNIY